MLRRVSTLAFMIILFGIRTLHTLPTQAATNNTYSNIIVSELMANPFGSDSMYEWIEIYNTTSEQIDLSEWKIQDKKLNGLIEPFSYLILARDLEALVDLYIDIEAVEVAISLKNSGDEILLIDPAGDTTDVFVYPQVEEGKSFERRGIPDYDEGCDEISINQDEQTIGEINSDVDQACWIADGIVEEAEEIEISNIQFSFDGIEYYDTINSYGETILDVSFEINTSSENILNHTYYTDEGFELETPLNIDDYFGRKIIVEVELVNGDEITGYSNDIYVYPFLEFTEIYYGDSNWIEIHNPNAYEVELANYEVKINNESFLIDDMSSDCVKHILSKEYCVFQINTFGLPVDVNFLVDDMVMQSLVVESIQGEESVSLYQGEWIQDFDPTPGKLNSPSDSNIIINEIYPSPNTGENEWLEIFNTSHFPIDLSGWYLTEALVDVTCSLNTNLPEIVLDGNSYLIIGQDDLKVSLNNSGDEIYLCNSENQIVSEVFYPEISKGISYSRLLDNSGNPISEFSTGNKPTPGSLNEFAVGNSNDNSEEVSNDPINIENVGNIADLDGNVIYAEGEIVGNYGSSFDIQTDKGILRVGFSNIDTPERSKGDFVKVTGLFEVDGDTFRVYPRSNEELEITQKLEEEKTVISKKTSNKVNSISSGSKTVSIAGLKSKPILPANIFETQNYTRNTEMPRNSKKEEVAILLMSIAAIILVLYSIYITELDNRFFNYIKQKNEAKVTYFKTNFNREKISRRAAYSNLG